MTTIRFQVHGTPTGKGRPRIVTNGKFPRAITPDKTRKAEDSFLAQALPYKPKVPLAGPLLVEITAYCPVPESWPKYKKAAALNGALRPTSKPDLDNIGKLILDAMNGVFFLDDSQIVELRLRKRFSACPRVEVLLTDGLPGELS